MAIRFRRRASPAPVLVDSGPARGEVPAAEAVLGGYRLLRRLASGERADVHLAVARQAPNPSPDLPDPEPALVVLRTYDLAADDAAIAVEIDAMEHDPTGTLPRLVDVATLPDGRACVVVERLGGRSLASVLAEGPLSAGQVVTAAAPLVVAVRELARRGLVHSRLASSDVLVDDTGRPRLIGLGALRRTDATVPATERVERSRAAHGALIALLDELAGASAAPSRFAEVVALTRGMLLARPFVPDHGAVERALFAAAEPTPLIGASRTTRAAGPVPSRVATGNPVGGGAGRDAVALPPHRTAPPAGSPGSPAPTGSMSADAPAAMPAGTGAYRLAELAQLPGIVDGLAGTLDAGPVATLRRRWRDWAGGRRTVLATGGLVGAGALVLLLTAVPPATAGVGSADAPGEQVAVGAAGREPSSGSSEAPAAPSAPGPDGEPSRANGGVEPGDETERVDPVEAASALLEVRAGCLASRDLACVAAYAQPGSPIEARDLASMASETAGNTPQADLAAIAVAADLGDAVVLSVPGADGREPASLLMMRSEAGWRLREWFD
ncbi:hypothetical protein [Agromyces sp. ZXT2-3]|uniref:hypothetical protein n=1 Tax=Agromyces sp. ZXT2-3 TaxID=3461152 RepID=UPI004054B7A1